jgi:hypothetical protein
MRSGKPISLTGSALVSTICQSFPGVSGEQVGDRAISSAYTGEASSAARILSPWASIDGVKAPPRIEASTTWEPVPQWQRLRRS